LGIQGPKQELHSNYGISVPWSHIDDGARAYYRHLWGKY
jgi:hypothetical protein